MCLAIPSKILEINGTRARVDLEGNVLEADISLIEEPEAGDWVLVHAGFAIEKLTSEEAEETLGLLMQASGVPDNGD